MSAPPPDTKPAQPRSRKFAATIGSVKDGWRPRVGGKWASDAVYQDPGMAMNAAHCIKRQMEAAE